MTVDAKAGADPTLDIALTGHGLDLAAVLAVFEVPSKVEGGRTEASVDLHLHGASPRAWASDARGSVVVQVGAARLPRVDSGLSPTLLALLKGVNPFRESDAVTDLKCAVVRLPLAGGVARVDRSIPAGEAVELGELPPETDPR